MSAFILQSGDTDAAKDGLVSAWQESLVYIGIPVAVDGHFGPETERATRTLQTQLGVTVDGIVGDETYAALKDKYPNVTFAFPATAEAPKTSVLLLGLAVAGVTIWGLSVLFKDKRK